MTRDELLSRINRARSLKIQQRLNTDKIKTPMDGVAFYKDMDPPFLEDILFITGTMNGVLLSEQYIKFVVQARQRHEWEPVKSFTPSFVRDETQKYWQGKCLAISDIIYLADVRNPDEVITVANASEEREAIPQIKWSIEGFVKRAVQRGYLLEEK